MDNEIAFEQLQELVTSSVITDLQRVGWNQYEMLFSPQLANSQYSNCYRMKLTVPDDYPESPPKACFLDSIYHLNVQPNSGHLFMALLHEDWSPFLTLSAIFESLNSLLQEPDVSYAADETLKLQYLYDPEKYAKNLKQMQNQQNEEQFQNSNQSIINSIQSHQQEEIKIDCEDLFPAPCRPSELRITGNLEYLQQEEENRRQLLNVIHEESEPVTSRMYPPVNAAENGMEVFANLNESIIHSFDGDHQFDQVMKHIVKADELFRIMVLECDSMENKLKSTKNDRLKRIIHQKYQNQLRMLEETLHIGHQLKSKLFLDIKQALKQSS